MNIITQIIFWLVALLSFIAGVYIFATFDGAFKILSAIPLGCSIGILRLKYEGKW